MKIPFMHPRLDELAAFSAGELGAHRREVLSEHLRTCQHCQQSLRFVVRVQNATAEMPVAAPPSELLSRVVSARAAGERIILPSLESVRPQPAGRPRRIVAGLAAAAILAVTFILVSPPSNLSAVAAESDLRIVPAAPMPGVTLHATYRPAPGLFIGADSLVLRARMRTARNTAYSSGVPARQTRAVATLRRVRDGVYEGSFTLPAGIVFASLAVEDAKAEHVDDHSGRLWEVLTYAAGGKPAFDALNQRADDMMGRSWEEGYASARRLVELYPDRVSAWSLREFFERALHDNASDSVSAAYNARLTELIAKAKAEPALPEDDIGTIFFRVMVKASAKGASAADSAEFSYWWERIRREYPRHSQVAQEYAGRMFRIPPRVRLDSLEKLYPQLAPLEVPGTSLFYAALSALDQVRDDNALRLWTERSNSGLPDSTLRVALMLSTRAPFREEGMNALRQLLVGPPEVLAPWRGLTQNIVDYARSVDANRRRVLAALGRALVANGNKRAGLDTLGLAAHGVWDVRLLQDVADTYLAAGDTVAAIGARVKLAVDPRTPQKSVDAYAAQGRDRLGTAGWDSATAVARHEMYALLIARSRVESLRGVPRVMAADGKQYTLGDLTGRVPAVVIFWSRHCGPALEAMPEIVRVAEQIKRAGTPVVFIVDESPSKDLADFLDRQKWTLPVYHDIGGVTKTAFWNFGTPSYYVLDGAGRIRFTSVSGVAELIAQVGAVGE